MRFVVTFSSLLRSQAAPWALGTPFSGLFILARDDADFSDMRSQAPPLALGTLFSDLFILDCDDAGFSVERPKLWRFLAATGIVCTERSFEAPKLNFFGSS
jgi:hypothetical protein